MDQFLSLTSKVVIEREYMQLYNGKPEAEQLYLQVLAELHQAIAVSSITKFKSLCNIIVCISTVENKMTLNSYYNASAFKNTNLVILTCKHDALEILKYIFSEDSEILDTIGNSPIQTIDLDESLHNTFYYAIRSSNVELLSTLIDEWPGEYFKSNLEELDEILSTAFGELELKNVLLSEAMEIWIKNRLLELRCFSNSTTRIKDVEVSIESTVQRIELVIDSIEDLKSIYSDVNMKVEEEFIFRTKFIVQNIHILKQRLKSTYDRLPWEEIEFCMICFISSHIKKQEINLFYRSILNKEKILEYLGHFAKRLEYEIKNIKEEDIYSQFPNNLERMEAVKGIKEKFPQFIELYKDYQEVRDLYSLERIRSYIDQAVLADYGDEIGQLVIIRALQVIGECLKNTLESPKISGRTIEFLYYSLPKNSRKIIKNLRNYLSHFHSLQQNDAAFYEAIRNDAEFYKNIQNDIKKFTPAIFISLYHIKIEKIKTILKMFIKTENCDEIMYISGPFFDIQMDQIICEDFESIENEIIEELVEELMNMITNKTQEEEQLFSEILKKLKIEKFKISNNKKNVNQFITSTQKLITQIICNGIVFPCIEIIKKLENDIVDLINSESFINIRKSNFDILKSVTQRLHHSELNKIKKISYKIDFITENQVNRTKHLEIFVDNFEYSISKKNKNKNIPFLTEETKNIFKSKSDHLKEFLTKHGFGSYDALMLNLPKYKENKNLQIAIEMLVLETLSVIFKDLPHNSLIIDSIPSLLAGRYLRNHLAHHDVFIDLLGTSIIVILNAQKFSLEHLTNNTGELSTENISNLKSRHQQSLDIINCQKEMCFAIKNGDTKTFNDCIKKGADVQGRNSYLDTTLHFAAIGPDLNVLKDLITQNSKVTSKNIYGQNILHLAANQGKKDIVTFLIDEIGLKINMADIFGQTALHLAAKTGNIDNIIVLFEKGAKIDIKDNIGLLPLYFAIQNNKENAVRIFLEKHKNADISCSCIALHVPMLLQPYFSFFDVLCVDQYLSVHEIHLYSNLEIQEVDGYTLLHYAVRCGYENIINILLEYGAKVDAIDNVCHNSPLHIAALLGIESIVNILLENNAQISKNIQGLTPLQIAKEKDYPRIVELISNHSEINENNSHNGNSILSIHQAVVLDDLDYLKNILCKDSKLLNSKNSEGYTPLHIASVIGKLKAIEHLVSKGAKLNSKSKLGYTALSFASMCGHIEVVRLLLQNCAQVDIVDNNLQTPLHRALEAKNPEVVKFLIDKGKAKVNVKDVKLWTPLHFAVYARNEEIVNILLDRGAKVNGKANNNVTPLYIAVQNNCEDIVNLLLKRDAHVNGRGYPLLKAVLCENRNIVKALLEHGADIKKIYIDNNTALHMATTVRNAGIVVDLIKKGADVNAKAIRNVTPLMLAAQYGYAEIVQILLDKKAKIDCKTLKGSTPLHMAIKYNKPNAVAVLLNKGADIYIKSKEKYTPIEYAVAFGSLEIVEMFWETGKVKINSKGKNGATLFQIALQEGNLIVAHYLLDKLPNNNGATIFKIFN